MTNQKEGNNYTKLKAYQGATWTTGATRAHWRIGSDRIGSDDSTSGFPSTPVRTYNLWVAPRERPSKIKLMNHWRGFRVLDLGWRQMDNTVYEKLQVLIISSNVISYFYFTRFILIWFSYILVYFYLVSKLFTRSVKKSQEFVSRKMESSCYQSGVIDG